MHLTMNSEGFVPECGLQVHKHDLVQPNPYADGYNEHQVRLNTHTISVQTHGLFSNLWARFGSRLYCGTSCLGVPKWDPTFGNYPHAERLARIWAYTGLLLRKLD